MYGILILWYTLFKSRNTLAPTTLSWFPWRACFYKYKRDYETLFQRLFVNFHITHASFSTLRMDVTKTGVGNGKLKMGNFFDSLLIMQTNFFYRYLNFFSFSTLRTFYTPHFLHSSFSTHRIFYTTHFLHSAPRAFHRTVSICRKTETQISD